MGGVIRLLAAIAALLAIGGCERGSGVGSRQVTGHPSEFFPTTVGSSWTYRIEISDPTRIARFEEVAWPRPTGGELLVAVRVVLPYSGELPAGPLVLELRVDEATDKQGPLEYPTGYRLSVTRDDVGFYEGAEGLYWAITGSGRYEVHQILTYDEATALSNWSAPQGYDLGSQAYNERFSYFVDSMGTQLQVQGSLESMALDALVGDLEGYQGQDCLRFIRNVEALTFADVGLPSAVGGPLTMPLLEKSWYCRSVGLVRLEQYVGGALSTTWTLTNYAPSAD